MKPSEWVSMLHQNLQTKKKRQFLYNILQKYTNIPTINILHNSVNVSTFFTTFKICLILLPFPYPFHIKLEKPQ